MSSKLKPCSHGFYSHHNCSDDAKAFQPPNCPRCGEPLNRVYWSESDTYVFNPETGTYGTEPLTGEGSSSCPKCGADLYPVLPHGPINHDAKHGRTPKDYLYCEDCKEFVDFWKYDYDLSAAGHEGHTTRAVTEEEFRQCLKDCERDGCFDEVE